MFRVNYPKYNYNVIKKIQTSKATKLRGKYIKNTYANT